MILLDLSPHSALRLTSRTQLENTTRLLLQRQHLLASMLALLVARPRQHRRAGPLCHLLQTVLVLGVHVSSGELEWLAHLHILFPPATASIHGIGLLAQ